MSDPLTYPVPFRLLARELSGPILRKERADAGRIYRAIVARMNPPPLFEGLDNLPETPRFILAANHYERSGLWIAHIASALACAMSARYGAIPPIRWIVTANWPRWRVGPFAVRSPGDILLPRVAHAVWCYAVPFAGTNPTRSAQSLRRLVKDAGSLSSPVGIFPEGAGAKAGTPGPPLPGISRLLSLMAAKNWGVLPVGVSEAGRFVMRFGCLMPAHEIVESRDPAEEVMVRVRALAAGSQ